MDSKKTFVIVLVILVLLYLASLGMGLVFNSSGEADLGALQKRAEGKIGAALEFFAERLELDDLQCNDEPVGTGFTLTTGNDDKSACTLVLDPGLKDDDEFVKTELRAMPRAVGGSPAGAGGMPTVYLDAGFIEEHFPRAERDKRTCILERADTKSYRLEVSYTPNDEPDTNWSCWLERELPLSLTVTRAGGTLSLQLFCSDCGDNDRRAVALRMK